MTDTFFNRILKQTMRILIRHPRVKLRIDKNFEKFYLFSIRSLTSICVAFVGPHFNWGGRRSLTSCCSTFAGWFICTRFKPKNVGI